MLIKSDKEDTFLKFERTDTPDYHEVTVTASVGGFILSTGTWFLESKRFVSSLSDFERTRRGSVLLSSDEFTMKIEPSGSAGSARIRFELSRRVEYYGARTAGIDFPSGRVVVTGEFGLGGEFIGDLLHDFSRLFRLGAHA